MRAGPRHDFFPVTIQMPDREVGLGTREPFVALAASSTGPRTGAETTTLPSEPGGVASTDDLGRPLIAEIEERA